MLTVAVRANRRLKFAGLHGLSVNTALEFSDDFPMAAAASRRHVEMVHFGLRRSQWEDLMWTVAVNTGGGMGYAAFDGAMDGSGVRGGLLLMAAGAFDGRELVRMRQFFYVPVAGNAIV